MSFSFGFSGDDIEEGLEDVGTGETPNLVKGAGGEEEQGVEARGWGLDELVSGLYYGMHLGFLLSYSIYHYHLLFLLLKCPSNTFLLMCDPGFLSLSRGMTIHLCIPDSPVPYSSSYL